MSICRGITFGVGASQRKSDLRNRLGRSILNSAKQIAWRRPGRGTLLETKMGGHMKTWDMKTSCTKTNEVSMKSFNHDNCKHEMQLFVTMTDVTS